MTIGQRIKSRRMELGMTVDELAEKLGKNRATVYRYESDEIKNMPLQTLVPLAKALRTTPADLMGDYSTAKMTYTYDFFHKRLMELFDELNRDGQQEALNRLQEMTSLEKYTKK